MVIPSFSSEADYLFDTSHLVFSYGVRPDRFGDQRQKFMFMSKEYNHTLGVIDEFQYTSSGVWSMARAEISYQDGGTPEPFHPSWTARMRPVALPGEWEEAGFDLNQAYHDSMGYMALAVFANTMANINQRIRGVSKGCFCSVGMKVVLHPLPGACLITK